MHKTTTVKYCYSKLSNGHEDEETITTSEFVVIRYFLSRTNSGEVIKLPELS